MRQGPRVRRAKALLRAWVRPAGVSAGTAALALGGAWAAWAHAVPFVTEHPYFRLRSVRVASDEVRVAPDILASIAGLYDDTSLWDVDAVAAEAALADASWVREARVARHFPWQVSVSVSRRHAAAATVAGGRAFLVDADGVLFREVDDQAAADLPYLTGWDQADADAEKASRLKSLLKVLADAEGHRLVVSELHMDADGAVWLYADGIKASVRIGDAARAATAFGRLSVALAELGPLADRARVIDTDYRDRIVVRGADDKLPALLAAQSEKNANGPEGSPETTGRAAAARPQAGTAGDATKAQRHG